MAKGRGRSSQTDTSVGPAGREESESAGPSVSKKRRVSQIVKSVRVTGSDDDDEEDAAESSDAYAPDDNATSAVKDVRKDKRRMTRSRAPVTYGPWSRFGLLPTAQFVTADRASQPPSEGDGGAGVLAQLSNVRGTYTSLNTRASIRPYCFQSRGSSITSFCERKPTDDEQEEADDNLQREPTIPFLEGLPSTAEQITFQSDSEGSMKDTILARHHAIPLKDVTGLDDAQGCIINAGSYIYSIDWAPQSGGQEQVGHTEYLAIAAALEPWPRTKVTGRIPPSSSPAAVQIWSFASSGWRSVLELVLCFDGGRIASVRWCPLAIPTYESRARLGVLAVAMQDGTFAVYDVPRPSSLGHAHVDGVAYVRPYELFRVDTKRGVPVAIDWLDASRVAVAFSDGYLGVWDFAHALTLAETEQPRPLIYARVARSSLSDVAWDAQGNHLYTSALDGSVYATSFEQPDFSMTLAHSRDVAYPIAYEHTIGAPIFERLEDASTRMIDFQQDKLGSRAVYPHYGRIRALCTSPHHPFVASGSADGSVKVANVPTLMENHRRWAGSGMTTVFRLEMTNRESASVRFVDGFMTMPLLRDAPDEVRAKYGSAKDVVTGPARFGLTMGWHPAVNVTAVRWNTNFGRETWLASGLAVGLVRIDVVGN